MGGFVLCYAIVGDPNEPTAPHGWEGVWRVLVLWAVLEVLPLVGMVTGSRARRFRQPTAVGAVVANPLVLVFLTTATLGSGLVDVLG